MFHVRKQSAGEKSFAHTSYETDMDGIRVVVFLTGIGWEYFGSDTAKDEIRILLEEEPTLCISTGLAGGLDPELKSGDVAAAIRVGRSAEGDSISSTDVLVRISKECGAKVVERLITSDHIVAGAIEKTAMGAFGNMVDMESFHVMKCVSTGGLPVIAVRAISDTADEDLPVNFEKILDHKGHLKLGSLIRELGARPTCVPSLLKFGKRSRRATVNLADFLDKYIPALAGRFGSPDSIGTAAMVMR